MIVQNGSPVIQLVHDIPWLGHGDDEEDRIVAEITLFQRELQ